MFLDRPGTPRSRLGPSRSCARQRGAALLALMLVLLTSSGYLLLRGLNDHTNRLSRKADSQVALRQAKQALLNYAMNYPELGEDRGGEKGPGFLPCPDKENTGEAASNCSDKSGTTLGRLPFRMLGLEDLRDADGERLWYAVSVNFKNTGSVYAVINSETPGLLRVDDRDDIVAVVIAPGAPVAAQHGRPSDKAADYLEAANADGDVAVFATSAGEAFNDQLLSISRAELMESVERRVLGEAVRALERYTDPDDNGVADYAYPWLAPFADPNADYRVLRGRDNRSGARARQLGPNDLYDGRRHFVRSGVAAHDIVRNATDGAIGIVTSATAKSLTVKWLLPGADDGFDADDLYYIERKSLPDALSGVAGKGAGGLTLRDRKKDFGHLDVIPGDVVENISDGSGGVIAVVDDDTLEVKGLSGGKDNIFRRNDRYRIKSAIGRAADGRAGLALKDDSVSFAALGVRPGDMVENLSDGSRGRVLEVTDNHTLRLASLAHGKDNVFQPDDVYRLSRFNSRADTRRGLLPAHRPGGRFPTAMQVDYAVEDGIFVTSATAARHTVYAAALERLVRSSAANGAIHIDIENGDCVWLGPAVAECGGVSGRFGIEGAVSFGAGTATLRDDAKDFLQLGIKRGDLVRSEDETATLSLVTGVTPTRLTTQGLEAMSPVWNTGDPYRIKPATGILEGTADSGAGNIMRDADGGFLDAGVVTGDIVENVETSAFGKIESVSAAELTTTATFAAGDQYRVYHSYADSRRYLVNARYRGDHTTTATAADGVKQRAVCFNYDKSCDAPLPPPSPPDKPPKLPYYDLGVVSTATEDSGLTLTDDAINFERRGVGPGDVVIGPGGTARIVAAVDNHSVTAHRQAIGDDNFFKSGKDYHITKPLITLESLRDDGAVVARSAIVIPPGGAQGHIRIGGLSAYFSAETGELPPWFVKHRWHKLIYLAYGAAFAPGGDGVCGGGSGDCLAVRGLFATREDRRAVALSAGMELDGADRATGAIGDYYEQDNAVEADAVFTRRNRSAAFNDQLRALAP